MLKREKSSIKDIFSREFLSETFIMLGSQVFVLAATIILISTTLFFLNIPINVFVLPTAILISGVITYLFNKEKFRKYSLYQNIYILLLLVIMYVVSYLIANYFYDVTWDGQDYHQGVILQLVNNHWNPIRDGAVDSVWMQHYPKASEIIASSLVAIVHHIEAGKAFNFLFVIAIFLLSNGVLLKFKKLPIVVSMTLSFVLAFNPISVCQIFSYYIDGQLISCIIGFLLMGYIILSEKKNYALVVWISLMIIMINLKFTGIMFAGVACVALLMGLLVQKDKHWFKKCFVGLLLTAIISVVFVGFNPYVMNTRDFKTPFYPISGENSIDIITPQTPDNFKGVRSIKRFIISTFYLGNEGEDIHWRFPFMVNPENLETYTLADSRIGGFGIFFGEIVVLSAIVLLQIGGMRKTSYKYLAMVIAFCLIPILVLYKEAWWARYVPTLFLIPWSVLVYSFISEKKTFFSQLLLFMLLLNCVVTMKVYICDHIISTTQISETLNTLKKSNEEIRVYFYNKSFENNVVRFEEKSIEYKVIDEKEDAESLNLGYKYADFYGSAIHIWYK